ncbi:MAG: CHAD domain-containing protein [Elainellaceae cyanobacterium]
MSYRLKSSEALSKTIKRIAHEQIEASIDVLSQASYGNHDKGVHQARKHFKKMRSLVRLVEGDIGTKAYKRESACFRDAGHQLEALRDSQVRLQAFDALLSHYTEFVESDSFDDIRQVLLEEYTAVHDTSGSDRDIATKVIPALRRANHRVDRWNISDRWSALEYGLYKQYARGYRAFDTVTQQPSPENLHDWRKRVKDLWCHLRLLSPLWPPLLKAWSNQAKTLSELLGDDHDLAVLRTYLMDDPTQFSDDASQLGVLLSLIRRRQIELQTAAVALGHRLYGESPKALAKRMRQYWRAWRTEGKRAKTVPPSSLDGQALSRLDSLRA